MKRAINDAERLLEKTGATSTVDRVHTALHRYLKATCDDEGRLTERRQAELFFSLIGVIK